MASYQQLCYCKNCKKNVSINDKGQCIYCSSTQIKKAWSVRFRYTEANGIEKQKRLTGYKTKKECEVAYLEYTNSTPHYEKAKQNKEITLQQAFDSYINWAENKLKTSSLYDFENLYKKHIKEKFGYKRLIDIGKQDVILWQECLEHYAYDYKSKIRTLFQKIFKHAMYFFDITYNPFTMVLPFRNTEHKKEMQIWTIEEFECFIKVVDNLFDKTLFTTLFLTGARKNELLALTWDDINFENKTITINKSLSTKIRDRDGKKRYDLTSPKNASSNRTIDIPDNLFYLFRELKKTSENNNVFFFKNEIISEKRVTRNFNQYIKQSNVKKIRIHDLRHSHASYLLASGCSVVDVAKRLGHKNINQTLNTYAHSMPNQRDLIIQQLKKIAI
ncbi:MAG: tyrosine-type recombinase/integrase [Clostridia bacterium]|nr:tyrosine-type recombinase/integrase [Clostridia bacterium]